MGRSVAQFAADIPINDLGVRQNHGGDLAALRHVIGRWLAPFLFPLKALVAVKKRHFEAVYGAGVDDSTPLLRGRYDIGLLTYEPPPFSRPMRSCSGPSSRESCLSSPKSSALPLQYRGPTRRFEQTRCQLRLSLQWCASIRPVLPRRRGYLVNVRENIVRITARVSGNTLVGLDCHEPSVLRIGRRLRSGFRPIGPARTAE